MDVLKWLLANWDSIIVVIAMIIVVIVLLKRGETTILKQILFNLVTKAEQEYGAGTGSLKYATVADWLYQRIPNVLKLLFTSKDIERMIESALEAAKEKWGTNPNIKEFTVCDFCGHPHDESYDHATNEDVKEVVNDAADKVLNKEDTPSEEVTEIIPDEPEDEDDDMEIIVEGDPSDAPVG